MSAKTSTDTITLVVSLYQEGQSAGAIARQLGISVPTVTKHLRAAGVELRSPSEACRRYPLDEHAFDAIKTEAQSYWLGFITADGGVNDRFELRLNLQLRDKAHLERLRDFLGTTLAVREKYRVEDQPNSRDLCYLSVRSVPLCESLARHGVVPRKSKVLQWPSTVSDALVHHYLRGYFDGNGTYCHASSSSQLQWRVAGSRPFLSGAQKTMMRLQNLSQTKLCDHHRTEQVAYLVYGGNRQISKIIDWLYSDATIFLERKLEIPKKHLFVVLD